MELIITILVAFGLCMDSFAISICNGMMLKKSKISKFIEIALIFGIVQFIFPVLGWALGAAVAKYIASFDHWIAFGLLAYLGGKMVYESFQKDDKCELVDANNFWNLVMMAVATSIDAMVVGLSLALIGESIIGPAAIIGFVTFSVCLAGLTVGQKIGHLFENKAELVGGLVLIGIGVKILVEHLL